VTNTIDIAKTTPEHVEVVADKLRQFDVDELKLFLGKEPHEALRFIHTNAQSCYTIRHNNEFAAIMGYNITDLLFNVASPFMLATKYAEEHPYAFAKYSPFLMEQFRGKFLRNWVAAKNEFAINWLKWLGFEIHEPELFNLTPVRMFTKDCR
jgi:hypothetical protein